MNLFKIAYRSIQQRGVASCMTLLSMALGVMMVVSVLSIHGIVRESFRRNSAFGYNMVAGAKGGGLQLTMNSAFYLSQPIENIPYDFYLEFQPQSQRDAEYENSIQRTAFEANWDTAANMGVMPTGALNVPLHDLAMELVQETTASTWGSDQLFVKKEGRPAIRPIDAGRDTEYGDYVDFAIPLCLGDYFGPFRVVGTTPTMLEKLKHGREADQDYEFAEGRNFKTKSEENGFFEAVVGATVAREQDVSVGDEIAPSHGAEDGKAHARKFTVVGVLAPTGTPQDRAVFVNIEGFFLMENHSKPIEKEKPSDDEVLDEPEEPIEDDADVSSSAEGNEPDDEEHDELGDYRKDVVALPIEQREVTSILIRTKEQVYAIFLENTINEGNVAQAVYPVQEINRLFETFVAPVQSVMLALTIMICIVSGVSIMVSIYNSMSDRKHEIAVMRALGAGRATIMSIILLESILLALGGGVLGWVGGHTLNMFAGPSIQRFTGVDIGFLSFAPGVDIFRLLGGSAAMRYEISIELLLIPALLLLAVVVGFLPALSAYRTDVAKALSS